MPHGDVSKRFVIDGTLAGNINLMEPHGDCDIARTDGRFVSLYNWMFREMDRTGLRVGDHIEITVRKIDPPKTALDEAEEHIVDAKDGATAPASRAIIKSLECIVQHLKEGR